MMELREMEAVVEAVLFVSNDPVPRDKLLEVFAENERPQAEEALAAVLTRYAEDPERGVMIDEAAGGLRLVSRPDLHGYLRRFFEVSGTNKLTMAALETLAIVAYRQPITGPEIQELRGVNSSGVLKTLLERRLVRIAGRKEVVGKPFLYATTREFLMRFGLRSLKELPPLEDFDELVSGGDDPGIESGEPDTEEEILREAAELEEREDEAASEAEADAIDEEREVAERVQEEAELAVAAGALPEPGADAESSEGPGPDEDTVESEGATGSGEEAGQSAESAAEVSAGSGPEEDAGEPEGAAGSEGEATAEVTGEGDEDDGRSGESTDGSPGEGEETRPAERLVASGEPRQ